MAGSEGLMSVDYEVSGRVQGVFFRKYTQVRAGWWDGDPGIPGLGRAEPAGAVWGL